MEKETSVRFVPSRTEGISEVSEIVIYPDRLEICTAGVWIAVSLDSIVHWRRPVWLRKKRVRFSRRPPFLAVAERDWFHPEGEKFFRFYTSPRLTVYLPAEEGLEPPQSLFRRVRRVMLLGGYDTYDLG